MRSFLGDVLEVTERALGAEPVDWQAPPYSLDMATMRAHPIITRRDDEARIVAIWFDPRGAGQFHRLIARIAGAGLSPIVVCPVLADMPAILKHWGWRRRWGGLLMNEEWEPGPNGLFPAT